MNSAGVLKIHYVGVNILVPKFRLAPRYSHCVTDFLLKLLYSNDVGSVIISHYCNSHIIISSVVLLWWEYNEVTCMKGQANFMKTPQFLGHLGVQ